MGVSYIKQDDGTTVTIKTEAGGKWARVDGDWQPVDEVFDALLENLSDGVMIATQRAEDGQFMFKLTEKGTAKTESMIGSDPDAAAFYAELARRHEQRPELTPTAKRVLIALSGGEADDIDGLVAATGFSRGQVMQALELLAEVGFVERPDDE